MVMESLSPTPDDIAELLRRNPIAAEQLKVIMLQRHAADLQARIAELESQTEPSDNGKGEGLQMLKAEEREAVPEDAKPE
jgi:hypothetical protein